MEKALHRLLFVNIGLLLCLVFVPDPASAEKEVLKVLNGVKYSGPIHAVMTKGDLDTPFELESIGIDGGFFSIKGRIIDGGTSYEINTKGEIYRSNIEFLVNSGANPFVVIPESERVNNIDILSISLEEKAYKALLVPANYDLEGTNLIKMAVKIESDVFYVEDEINNMISFEDVSELSESIDRDDIATAAKQEEKEDIEAKIDKISDSESWYLPYLDFTHDNSEDNESSETGMNSFIIPGHGVVSEMPITYHNLGAKFTQTIVSKRTKE